MKIAEAIERIDKSPRNEYYVCYDTLADSMGIYDFISIPEEPRLSGYWLAKQIDGDSLVGLRVYFLDDVFVCMSEQTGRKSDELFSWLSASAYKEVKDYLLSLTDEEDELTYVNLDDEISSGTTLQFASQLCGSTVIYNGETRSVDRTWKEPDDKFRITRRIKLDGDDTPIDISECLIPYHVT